jgi:uncharacterized Fe-S center protein
MSVVYFSDMKTKKNSSPLNKVRKLFAKCKPEALFGKDELIAIKTHFGELGNTAFTPPIFLRPVVETLKNLKTKPYLTDTNTLYIGMRTNSVDHLHNVNMNGFGYSTLGVPAIIADGLRGENTLDVPINGELLKSVKLASDIINADGLVCVAHFKGHELSGFGGAIKSLSMGCASRQGKLEMHSATRPVVKEEKCTSCGRCLTACAHNAIIMTPKARITEKCTGCARCIAVCPEKIIEVNWDETTENTQLKMAEYAMGAHCSFKGKSIYLNMIINISPACDCYGGNDAPICGDIGFMSSTDPVAIDQASYDMVVKQFSGKDPFKELYSYLNPEIQLAHAEKIGMGSRKYELVEVN